MSTKRIQRWLQRMDKEIRREDERLSRQFERQIARTFRRIGEMARGLRCKHCGSADVVRFGTYKGLWQKYRCKDCGRVFADTGSLPYMQTPTEVIGAALSGYYRGMPLGRLRQHLQQQYGRCPSKSTLYSWFRRFSKKAIAEANEHIPNVGSVWVADETFLKVGGRNVVFWDLIDARTRFLLASRLSTTRGTRDAFILMHRAALRAGGRIPEIVLTDKLKAYLDGVELAFGSATKHIPSKGFTVRLNTNLIERFHGTLKDRTEVMRGLQNMRSARLFLDGWLVHYNFFRPHESLRDRTPAEVAGITFPYRHWLDVVQHRVPQKAVEAKTDVEPQKLTLPREPTHKRKTIRQTAKARSRRAVSPSLSVMRL